MPARERSCWRKWAYLRRGSRIASLLGVAAIGTLAGHAVTYLVRARTKDFGHHGYSSPPPIFS